MIPVGDSEDPKDRDYIATPICRMVNHQIQFILHYQTFWKQEYLTALRGFYKVKDTYTLQSIKVGDVVFIHDDSPMQGQLEDGCDRELISGNDGYV